SLLLHLSEGAAAAALILRRRCKVRNVRMIFYYLSNCLTQSARAVTMNDPELAQAVQKRLIEEFVHCLNRLVGSLTDDIQLSARCCLCFQGKFYLRTARTL